MEPTKNTLVIYEYPAALGDVYRWAFDNKFILGPPDEPLGFYHFRVDRKGETIHLIPSIYLDQWVEDVDIDKLVLWGSFDKSVLDKIMEVVYHE